MPDFRIRPASPADVPIISSLIRELAEYERMLDEVTYSDEDLRTTLFGPKPYAEVVIAEEAGEPVGYALFFHNYSTFKGKPGLYLEDLFIKLEHRGKGYGKALLVHLAKLAEERGCVRFEWVVLDWNTPSIEFYKSLGAVPLETWNIYRLQGEALASVARLGNTDC